MSVKIATTTKVVYPAVGEEEPVSYYKYDYFSCSAIELIRALQESAKDTVWNHNDALYNYLNDNGHWQYGNIEIDDGEEEWIEAHPELHGMQDEFVITVEVATRDECITLDLQK